MRAYRDKDANTFRHIDEAARVLAGMGLTVSDACRMTLTMIARDKRLPFSNEPNEETRQTLEQVDKIP